MINWEREVECEWSATGSSDRHMNAESKSGGDPKVIAVDFDILLNGTEVTEKYAFEHVIGCNGERVLDGVQPLEPAPDAYPVLDG